MRLLRYRPSQQHLETHAHASGQKNDGLPGAHKMGRYPNFRTCTPLLYVASSYLGPCPSMVRGAAERRLKSVAAGLDCLAWCGVSMRYKLGGWREQAEQRQSSPCSACSSKQVLRRSTYCTPHSIAVTRMRHKTSHMKGGGYQGGGGGPPGLPSGWDDTESATISRRMQLRLMAALSLFFAQRLCTLASEQRPCVVPCAAGVD